MKRNTLLLLFSVVWILNTGPVEAQNAGQLLDPVALLPDTSCRGAALSPPDPAFEALFASVPSPQPFRTGRTEKFPHQGRCQRDGAVEIRKVAVDCGTLSLEAYLHRSPSDSGKCTVERDGLGRIVAFECQCISAGSISCSYRDLVRDDSSFGKRICQGDRLPNSAICIDHFTIHGPIWFPTFRTTAKDAEFFAIFSSLEAEGKPLGPWVCSAYGALSAGHQQLADIDAREKCRQDPRSTRILASPLIRVTDVPCCRWPEDNSGETPGEDGTQERLDAIQAEIDSMEDTWR